MPPILLVDDLQCPERVARVAALDIAPVRYSPRFGPILKALEALDLTRLQGRAEADALLATGIRNAALRAYLLQNLVLEHGQWRWRMSLTNLSEALPRLLDFPQASSSRPFTGPALFLYGARSDYIEGRYLPAIRALFPFARLRAVAGAAPARLAALCPGLRPDVLAAVDQLLEREPARRTAHLARFAARLDTLAGELDADRRRQS